MSGGTATPPLSPQSPMPTDQAVVSEPSPLEALIEERVSKTRRQVKGVDIVSGLMTLATGGLVYIFVAALLDHWLVSGGLGFWGRLLLWVILVFGAGLYFVKFLWPAIVLRINPVYAAQTIEQSRPTFKNSLINFMLLRSRQREMAPVIYQALEQRAAADVKEVRVEVAVDRQTILQLSYLLTAVVAVICLYLAISPKSLLSSAARVLWPWSNIHAPTRVSIENVQPGDARRYHGDFVAVSADVRGLKEGESVLLHFSTADGEIIDQRVPMLQEGGAYRHLGKLPPGGLGLQQDYTYFISAGDSRTDNYKIIVEIAPIIKVEKVDYHYPAYTGIPDRTMEHQADISAIEGTEVTIHAGANQPIERAEIEFPDSRLPGKRMEVDGRTASGQLTLRISGEGAGRTGHGFYQVRFVDKSGRKDRQPIRHSIEVLRDLPPEVKILEPQIDEIAVAEDGRLEIRVWAKDQDPDFGLRRAAICAEKEKQCLAIAPLLNVRSPEKAASGEFQDAYEFQPRKLKLKAGDRVAYWAEADDSKEPSPNVTTTEKKWITVVGPDNAQGRNDQQQSGQQQSKKSTEAKPEEKGDKGDQAQKGDKNQETNQGEKGGESSKGEKGDTGGKSDKGDKDKQGEKGGKGQQSGKTESSDKNEKGGNGEKGAQQKQGAQADKGQSAGDKSSSEEQGESSQANERGGKATAAQQKDQKSSPPRGDQSAERREPIDPDANPGDAFQEILKQRQEQQKGQLDNQQAGNQQSGKQQPADEESAGGRDSDGKQVGKQQTGTKSTDQQGQSSAQTGEQQQAGEKQSGARQTEEKRAGEIPTPLEKQGADQGQAAGSKEGDESKGKPNAEKSSSQQGQKQPAGAEEKQNKPPEQGVSPSMGKKPLDEKDEKGGERSGGEKQSGAEQAQKPGEKGEGSQAAGDQGALQAKQEKQGEMTKKPGEAGQEQKSASNESGQKVGSDSGDKQQPGQEDLSADQEKSPDTSADQAQGKPQEGAAPGKQPGQTPSAQGLGNMPTGGGQQGMRSEATEPVEAEQAGADKINLDFARKQTELALEYLQDQLAKDRPEVLDRLGWTREQAQRFLSRWQEMRKAAAQEGPQTETAKRQLNDALKSLGLRPGTTFLEHGEMKSDQMREMRDAGRFAPPAEWAEQFREYTRGVANQESESRGQETGDK